jgi:effector-binding domain-containing protein
MRIAEMYGEAAGGGPANVSPLFSRLIPELLEVFAQNDVRPGISIGRYDDPREDGTLGVHVGFVIDDQVLDAPDVDIVEVPSREVVAVVHEGPIDNISSWYEDLYRWIEDSGRKPVGNPVELYRHWDDKNPDNNVTEIYVPIER